MGASMFRHRSETPRVDVERGMSTARILPPARRMKNGPLGWLLILIVGLGGWWDSAEVAVFEAVAVSLHRDGLGVVDEVVDHRGGDHVVAEDLARPSNGLLLVTIRLARSHRDETSRKNRFEASASNGM
jgi:hypothetical protein